MKILIVDDRFSTKCGELITECQKREIETKVAISIREALYMIYTDKDINGLVLDMGLPIYSKETPIERGGETVLKHLEHKKIRIPVLVFSETEMRANYISVFDQMKDWNEAKEKKKFFDFIEELEKREKEQP